MKAIVVPKFGGPEVMQYMDMDKPSISSTQVLIRVVATSVNYADIKTRYGNKGEGKFPFIPGLDCAGVVEEVGKDVVHLKAGQRVIAFPKSGSYAEFAAAEEYMTFPIPNGVDFHTAAACPIVLFTSYKLLADVARIEKGETVLVHAASGGIGTTAIQLAKLLGARKVIGTVGSEAKVAAAINAGADDVIVRESEDFIQKVNELTGGNGVDVILDSIAGDVAAGSLKCLAKFGRMVNFGNASGVAGEFNTSELHNSSRAVLGFSFGTTRKHRPHQVSQIAERALPFLEKGQINLQIGRIFPLAEAEQANRFVESRESTGKILLDVSHGVSN
ncbi:quinone oxidoreductase [Bacillus sp. M6-12]|uniref:quinone oxidoreductase family protein n=1 Tax=Bacillus sp. M6-12 TaxID=2054166 RepID=UPI000C78B9A7|nr:NADPH:quinone oxidoreductase family protein [Bacillus sp. M6-12]PLS14813.1 quinone oxidoreductase [Bacillus sp. M6-12]